MTGFLATRTGKLASAAGAALIIAAVVLAVVLAGGGGSHTSSTGGDRGNGLTIRLTNLKGAPAGHVVVKAVLADAKSHLVEKGILQIHHQVVVNPLPPTARILAVSVGDCAHVPVSQPTQKRVHGKKVKPTQQRFRLDCSTYTHASSLPPIKLTGQPQSVEIGLYCVRPGGVIDCSASRVSTTR